MRQGSRRLPAHRQRAQTCQGPMGMERLRRKQEINAGRRQASNDAMGATERHEKTRRTGAGLRTSGSSPGRRILADRVGFEPTIRFHIYTRSRRAPSTTRPPVRTAEKSGRASNITRLATMRPLRGTRSVSPGRAPFQCAAPHNASNRGSRIGTLGRKGTKTERFWREWRRPLHQFIMATATGARWRRSLGRFALLTTAGVLSPPLHNDILLLQFTADTRY